MLILGRYSVFDELKDIRYNIKLWINKEIEKDFGKNKKKFPKNISLITAHV